MIWSLNFLRAVKPVPIMYRSPTAPINSEVAAAADMEESSGVISQSAANLDNRHALVYPNQSVVQQPTNVCDNQDGSSNKSHLAPLKSNQNGHINESHSAPLKQLNIYDSGSNSSNPQAWNDSSGNGHNQDSITMSRRPMSTSVTNHITYL